MPFSVHLCRREQIGLFGEDLEADTGGEVLVVGVDAGVDLVVGGGRNTLMITITRTAS